MRIRDLIDTLSEFDQDIELVIDLDGEFITPSIKKGIVHYKHEYTGTSYKDAAVVLSK